MVQRPGALPAGLSRVLLDPFLCAHWQGHSASLWALQHLPWQAQFWRALKVLWLVSQPIATGSSFMHHLVYSAQVNHIMPHFGVQIYMTTEFIQALPSASGLVGVKASFWTLLD